MRLGPIRRSFGHHSNHDEFAHCSVRPLGACLRQLAFGIKQQGKVSAVAIPPKSSNTIRPVKSSTISSNSQDSNDKTAPPRSSNSARRLRISAVLFEASKLAERHLPCSLLSPFPKLLRAILLVRAIVDPKSKKTRRLSLFGFICVFAIATN